MFHEVYGEVCFMKCTEMDFTKCIGKYVLRNVWRSIFMKCTETYFYELYGDVRFMKCTKK